MPKGSSLIDEQNNHPYITVSNMNADLEDMNNFQFVPLDIFPQIKNYIVDENDLIISVAGTLGLVKKVPKVLDKANLTENANRISEIQISEDYLYFYLNSNLIQNRILSVQTNNAQPKLALKEVRNFKIKYPSNKEQKKIANLFLRIDKKIELLEKKLVLYQELELSLKNKIFNSFNNNSFVKLKDICLIKKGKQLNKSDMIVDGKYYVLNGGKEPSGYTNSWNVKENTITISEGGNSCGFVSFNNKKFYCGGHCYYLTLKQDDFDLNYLFHYLKFVEPNIMKLRVGSGLPNIQKGDIENIAILKVDFNQQKEIGNFLRSMENRMTLIFKEKEELEIFKKGLLQKMFI